MIERSVIPDWLFMGSDVLPLTNFGGVWASLPGQLALGVAAAALAFGTGYGFAQWRFRQRTVSVPLVPELQDLAEQLEGREAHLQAALIGSQTGTWCYREDEDQITFCAQAAALLGLTDGLVYCASELVQDIVEEDQADAANAFRTSLETGAPFQVTYRIVHPEQGIRSLRSSGQAIRTARGQVMYGVLVDVTAEQQLVEELNDQRRVLEATKRLARVGYCWIDLLKNAIEISEIASEVLEERFPETISLDEFGSSFRPANKENFEQALAHLRQQPGEVTVDLELGRSENQLERVWQLTAFGDGSGTRIHAVVQDVSAVRLASQAVFQSEHRFRAAMESMIDGILIISDTGRILTSNASARRMLGLSVEQLAEPHSAIELLNFLDTDQNPFAYADHPVARAFCTGQSEQGLMLIFQGTRVGEPLFLSVNLSPILAQGSEYAQAVVVIMRDTSDERRWQRSQAETVMCLSESEQEQKRLARELQEANLALTQLAQRDGLTGMYNHRSWHERLQEELRQIKDKGPLTVALLDVDFFKKFNDDFGHQVGDEVLKRVAQVLHDCFTEPEFTARYGGEEFGILLPGVSGDEAAFRLEQARQAICAIDGIPRPVSASFGAVTAHCAERPAAQWLSLADEALYQSKHRGRNIVTFLQPTCQDERAA